MLSWVNDCGSMGLRERLGGDGAFVPFVVSLEETKTFLYYKRPLEETKLFSSTLSISGQPLMFLF